MDPEHRLISCLCRQRTHFLCCHWTCPRAHPGLKSTRCKNRRASRVSGFVPLCEVCTTMYSYRARLLRTPSLEKVERPAETHATLLCGGRHKANRLPFRIVLAPPP